MLQTHQNFKSTMCGVTSADDIEDLIGTALSYQYMLEKRTSPWEVCQWVDEELEDFQIVPEDVDRLYYIYFNDDGVSGRDFEFVGRMEYNGQLVYVKMTAGCDFTGFDCQGGGEIYLSYDAQVFLKSIIVSEHNPHEIWKAMVQDGLDVEEPSPFDLLQMKAWNSVPMLKFLCHMAVYENREKLSRYAEVLSPPAAASVQDFIKARETRDHHDEGE